MATSQTPLTLADFSSILGNDKVPQKNKDAFIKDFQGHITDEDLANTQAFIARAAQEPGTTICILVSKSGGMRSDKGGLRFGSAIIGPNGEYGTQVFPGLLYNLGRVLGSHIGNHPEGMDDMLESVIPMCEKEFCNGVTAGILNKVGKSTAE